MRKKSESDALLDHIHRIGTTCNIIDWEGLEKGFLGILVEGGERFTVHDIRVLENRLWTARVTEIEDLPDRNPALPGEFRDMAMLLEKILARLKPVYKSEWLIDDSKWVGSQLAALLPLDADKKQVLLEMDDAVVRLHHLRDEIRKIGLL